MLVRETPGGVSEEEAVPFAAVAVVLEEVWWASGGGARVDCAPCSAAADMVEKL